MKHLDKPIFFLLLLLFASSCESWKLDRISFLEVHTIDFPEKTFTSVKIKGEIKGLAGEISLREHGFVWSATNNLPTIDDNIIPNGVRKNNGEFLLELTDLTLNSTYYIRAFAELETGIVYEEEVKTFTPEFLDLGITMDSIKKGIDEVTFYGTVKGIQSGVNIVSHGHVWSTETNWPTIAEDNAIFSGVIANDEVVVESKLENLETMKEYHVRTFIISGSQPIYSQEVISFTKGNVWVKKSSLPTGMSARAADHYLLMEDDNIYFHTSTQFGKFDAEQNQWTPLNAATSSGSTASFSIGKNIYLVQTNVSGGTTWEYNTETSSWTDMQFRFPGGQRWGALGFAIGNKGYVGWGNGSGGLDRSFYVFEPGSGWGQQIAPFPITRRTSEHIVSFQFKDRFCLGMGKQDIHTDFWCYEPDSGSGKWVSIPRLPVAAASAFFNFRTFTIGEKGYLHIPTETNNFWEFDNTTEQWTLRADFPGGQDPSHHFANSKRGYLGKSNREIWEYIPESQ